MATFTNEELYAPCFCGSDKKLKFCCKDKRSRTATPAELARLEKALDALDNGDVDFARPVFEKLFADGLGTIEVRLGLIASMVSMGEIDEATTAAQTAWSIPGDGRDAAGATLAHLLCLRGDTAEATRLIDDILPRASSAPTDVMAILGALNALERDADIVGFVKGDVAASVPLAPYARAVALLNLGDRDNGLPALRAAALDDPDVQGLVAQVASSSSSSSSSWPWPRLETVPLDLFLPSGGGSPAGELAVMGRFVDDEAGSRLVARGLRSGLLVQDQPRFLHGILGFIAALQPTVALSTLRDVWQSSWSSDTFRRSAAQQAIAWGLIADGSTLSMITDGVRADVVVHRVDARTAAVLDALGATAIDERALAKGRHLLRAGQSKPALAAFEALLAHHPDSALLQHQVFSQQLMQQQIDDDTFIAKTTALLARVPQFLEARQSLARLLEVIGRVDEARAVLNDSHLVDVVDEETECFTHMVLARLALHADDDDAVARHVHAAEQWLGRDLLAAVEPQLAAAVYGDA